MADAQASEARITDRDMAEWRAARKEGREQSYWKDYAMRTLGLSAQEADAAATRVIAYRDELAQIVEVNRG